MARELTLICPGPESPRLSALLAAVRKAHPFQQVSWMTDDLRDRRLLIAAAIPPSGVNLELYQLLAFLRTHPGCLAGSTAGVVIDGTGDLYTKAAGRDLVLSASQAGCVFPGRPLVEATGSLRNFTVQARNGGGGRSCWSSTPPAAPPPTPWPCGAPSEPTWRTAVTSRR